MLAAEFRTWFWSTFRIDIPFLDILGSKYSLHPLRISFKLALWAQHPMDGLSDKMLINPHALDSMLLDTVNG